MFSPGRSVPRGIVVNMSIILEPNPNKLAGRKQLIIREVANGTAKPAVSKTQAASAIPTGFLLAGDPIAKGARIPILMAPVAHWTWVSWKVPFECSRRCLP